MWTTISKTWEKGHDSYIQDTPDFLRQLQHINQNETLPDNALLVVIDAIGLYTNIPQE